MKDLKFIAFLFIILLSMIETPAKEAVLKKSVIEVEIKNFSCFPGMDWHFQNKWEKSLRGKRNGDTVGFSESTAQYSEILGKQKAGFIFQLTVRNISDKTVAGIVWEYNFSNPITGEFLGKHIFNSLERIKPHRQKELYFFSEKPPTNVISVDLLLRNPRKPYLEEVVITSIQFENK